MSDTATWLNEGDVAKYVSLTDAIQALEQGLLELNGGRAFNVAKALGSFETGASMHSLGSAMPDSGYCGYKNWVNTPQGAKSVYVLFNATEGRLLAIMEANVLGQLRTSAMTGLGTKWMAAEDAAELAIIGTGRQALMQVRAIHAVRPLRRVRVWSPTPEKRAAFVETLRDHVAADIAAASTLREALRDAPIVTLVTRAAAPFVSASMLASSTHVNAVGAILPGNAEFHQDVFERAAWIAVDDLENTRRVSQEFKTRFGSGNAPGSWDSVIPLQKIVAGESTKPMQCDLSLFKAVGMGISDLCIAKLAYERARQDGTSARFSLSRTAQIR
jgi:ornithine cyclodeaminase